MNRFSVVVATLGLALTGGAALSAERTVNIEVTGLYCSSCPYIASQAIQSVESARITGGFYDANRQMARFVVQYDDEKATVDQLLQSTMQYGYPASLVKKPAQGS